MENWVLIVIAVSLFTGGITIALAAMFAALGQGKAIVAALEAIGRNPEAQPKIQMVMIIGLAFIESLALYALFIAIMLTVYNPFYLEYVKGLLAGGGAPH